jgi:hypothetical protein
LGDEAHKSDIESARSDVRELKNVSDLHKEDSIDQKTEEIDHNQIEILDEKVENNNNTENKEKKENNLTV